MSVLPFDCYLRCVLFDLIAAYRLRVRMANRSACTIPSAVVFAVGDDHIAVVDQLVAQQERPLRQSIVDWLGIGLTT